MGKMLLNDLRQSIGHFSIILSIKRKKTLKINGVEFLNVYCNKNVNVFFILQVVNFETK